MVCLWKKRWQQWGTEKRRCRTGKCSHSFGCCGHQSLWSYLWDCCSGMYCRHWKTQGKKKRLKVMNSATSQKAAHIISYYFDVWIKGMGYSLWLGCPGLVPVLVTHQQEGECLEAQADEDLSEYGEEQRTRDQAWGGSLRNHHIPRWIQTHWVWKTQSK